MEREGKVAVEACRGKSRRVVNHGYRGITRKFDDAALSTGYLVGRGLLTPRPASQMALRRAELKTVIPVTAQNCPGTRIPLRPIQAGTRPPLDETLF